MKEMQMVQDAAAALPEPHKATMMKALQGMMGAMGGKM
jgi:hypothetical protein